jgi:hypothetical protein
LRTIEGRIALGNFHSISREPFGLRDQKFDGRLFLKFEAAIQEGRLLDFWREDVNESGTTADEPA